VRARAIVHATTNFEDPAAIADASASVGEAMPGLDVKDLDEQSLLQHRGW
jgi:pyridoxal 5'-phosphate synthase pdxS subunit